MSSNEANRVPAIDEALRQGPLPPVETKPAEIEVARYVPPESPSAPLEAASHAREPAPSLNPLGDHARELQLEAEEQDRENPILP
jgi:hypothetical protein